MHALTCMAHVSHDISEFWHNHAGARFLAPMIAVLAIVVLGMLYMVVYPHL